MTIVDDQHLTFPKCFFRVSKLQGSYIFTFLPRTNPVGLHPLGSCEATGGAATWPFPGTQRSQRISGQREGGFGGKFKTHADGVWRVVRGFFGCHVLLGAKAVSEIGTPRKKLGKAILTPSSPPFMGFSPRNFLEGAAIFGGCIFWKWYRHKNLIFDDTWKCEVWSSVIWKSVSGTMVLIEVKHHLFFKVKTVNAQKSSEAHFWRSIILETYTPDNNPEFVNPLLSSLRI